jgi:hypothetical protein
MEHHGSMRAMVIYAPRPAPKMVDGWPEILDWKHAGTALAYGLIRKLR